MFVKGDQFVFNFQEDRSFELDGRTLAGYPKVQWDKWWRDEVRNDKYGIVLEFPSQRRNMVKFKNGNYFHPEDLVLVNQGFSRKVLCLL